MKSKKCKVCKESFEPLRPLQMVCSPICGIEYTKKQKEKQWKKEKSQKKKDLMTLQDWIKIAQSTFNTFIRLRDEGNLCISCQKPPKKKNAGHFRSVGSCPELRFEEINCHLQCEYCNTFKHGNLLNYRKNLIKKIGLNAVEWLEEYKDPTKYTIAEVREINELYKKKIKDLK